MKLKFMKRINVEAKAKYLECWIGVRYLEDAEINGEDDTDSGDLLSANLPQVFTKESDAPKPMRGYTDNGVVAHILINLDNGKVGNWTEGVTAKFHYKSCDINVFRLLDADMNVIYETPNEDTEYVIGPDFMNEYGDYFVLRVDADGFITDYNKDEMEYEIKRWIEFHEDPEN
jgi:hypothetical protein